MPQKSIYALLIAINDYPAGINSLRGCVPDMHAFRDYLSKQCDTTAFNFVPLVLENAAAKRDAVIAGFQHFQSATEGDVCVLYYSGHGSRIPTTDFWEAHDGFNEAIVCHDKCLADKELSCLIHEIMDDKQGVHFLSVMDSCHSGSNTRYSEGVTIRMSNPSHFPQNITEYYGFDKKLYKPDGQGKYSAPKATHINFSACRNHQTAKEMMINLGFRGAFTASLIEALDTSYSALSYVDLERRVAQKISNRVAEQLPMVDAVNGANPNVLFMGGAIAPKNRYFVSWNDKIKAWELNAGEYHGINTNSSTPSVIWLQKGEIGFALESISASTSTGKWVSQAFIPDLKKQYDVEVQVGGGQTRKVAYSPDCAAATKDLVSTYFPKARTNYVQISNNIDEAEFVIHADANEIWLRRKGEDRYVFYPVSSGKLEMVHASEFWQNVDNVLQWFHLKNLDNPATTIKSEEITLSLFRSEGAEAWWEVQVENMEKLTDWAKPNTFSYQGDLPPSFALSIENTSGRLLFCSALFMSGSFGIANKYLPIIKLNPQDKVFLTYTEDDFSTKSIGIGILTEGVTEQIDYLKIMVSTADFDTSVFIQDSLNIQGAASPTRDSLKMVRRAAAITKPDWTSFLLPFQIVKN